MSSQRDSVHSVDGLAVDGGGGFGAWGGEAAWDGEWDGVAEGDAEGDGTVRRTGSGRGE